MFASDSDVSDLLGRVMSRTPAPEKTKVDRRPQPETDDDNPSIEGDGSWRLPGIFGQTPVATNFGKVPAQLIRAGDCVRTRSGRYRPVQKVRETKMEAEFFKHHPEARPVLIRRDAVARGCPQHDILLSPAQAVMVSGSGGPSRAVAARDLAEGFHSVDRTLGMVAYYAFELDDADDISCEGLWVTSAATSKG